LLPSLCRQTFTEPRTSWKYFASFLSSKRS
jgi:hypothetical protein